MSWHFLFLSFEIFPLFVKWGPLGQCVLWPGLVRLREKWEPGRKFALGQSGRAGLRGKPMRGRCGHERQGLREPRKQGQGRLGTESEVGREEADGKDRIKLRKK